ncbi:MAG: DUF4332 domain-containing protein [Leptolyngbya sp. SIOISBB]|nr:DUF4332 domain-containing protein [Leptolyngbya sp. SIOISBB]
MAAINLQSHPLQRLPGLSVEHLTQLQQAGLTTTGDLLRVARSPGQLQAIAAQLKLPLRYLQKWLALADLACLPSVGSDYCGLLLHSGVASVAQLSIQAPGRLHTQIRKLHTMTMRRSDLCPTPDQVVQWVQEAKLAQG